MVAANRVFGDVDLDAFQLALKPVGHRRDGVRIDTGIGAGHRRLDLARAIDAAIERVGGSPRARQPVRRLLFGQPDREVGHLPDRTKWSIDGAFT